MATQTIDMDDVTSVKYNGNDVSTIKLNGTSIWYKPIQANYILFESNDNTQFSLRPGNYTKGWNGTMEYSTDGATWHSWDSVNSLGNSISSHHITGRLYIRGSNNTVVTGQNASATARCWQFHNLANTTTRISCTGNIENLLDYTTVSNDGHPVMGNYAFKDLFIYQTSLTSIPDLSKINTLSNYCYREMFYGCTSLTTVPEDSLPATIPTEYCYADMFEECSSLTNAPKIYLQNLRSQYCCYSMFRGCTSLTTLPAFVLTDKQISGSAACRNMFYSCTNIKVSETRTGDYQNEYTIPTGGGGTVWYSNILENMFKNTGGTFTGNPSVNVTYYTSNTVVYPT